MVTYAQSGFGVQSSSATSLTLSSNMSDFCYVFTGSSAATWTLNPVVGNEGQQYLLVNRGTANITVQRAGSDNIWINGQTATSFTLPVNARITLVDDGTNWVAEYMPGIVDAEQFITLTSAYTLALNQTAAQKMFNSPTNGTLTVPIGTYFFDCIYTLSGLSGTTQTFGFALGGTATKTQLWESEASKAALATAVSTFATMNTTNANVALTGNSVNTVGWAHCWGKIRVSVAGTIIPQVSLGIAVATAVVGVDSYFRIWNVGLNTAQSAGAWS